MRDGRTAQHPIANKEREGSVRVSEQRPWRMSIVETGMVDPRTLLEHPRNPKMHTEEQDAVVGASLHELGWLRRLLWNRRTGHVLDGHERLKLAVERGEPVVPVDICDMPEADEGKVLLLLDQSAALAQPHPERWAELWSEVHTDEPALVGFWVGYAAQYGLMAGEQVASRPIEEAEVGEERLSEVRAKWPVQAGEIWGCGRHRVVCGDCREPEVLERLLGGVVPTIVVADPPYGVSIVQVNGYVGGGEAYNIPFGGVKKDRRKRVSGGQRVKDRTGHYPIETWGKEARGTNGAPASRGFQDDPRRGGPKVGVAKYTPVIGDDTTATAVQVAQQLLTAYPQAVHVWWGANYYTEALWPSQCWLVWNKETTGNFADCELAWTNQDKAARLFTHRWNGMLRESERERRWHPTQKPAALLAWVYEVVGHVADVVLDPFLGSGPSLLAAEQRGQTVYACDLSPDCCAVALERWALLSGGTPKRLSPLYMSGDYR